MIGPTSSHTAGAVRIGKVSRKILGDDVARAEIGLAGSFAQTGRGHGTDRALLAGLMGMGTDDDRIKNSFTVANEQGLEFHFVVFNGTNRLYFHRLDRRSIQYKITFHGNQTLNQGYTYSCI
jgi:iron-sulfur-dependent L-serine dehydratase beta subunit